MRSAISITPLGEKLLVNNTPLIVNDQVVLIIQSARALTDRDRSLESLSQYLIIAWLITTLAAFGDRIYVVNAKFGAPSPESIPYEVVRVEK